MSVKLKFHIAFSTAPLKSIHAPLCSYVVVSIYLSQSAFILYLVSINLSVEISFDQIQFHFFIKTFVQIQLYLSKINRPRYQSHSLVTKYGLSHSCIVMLVLILAPCDECVVAQCEKMNILSTCASSKWNASSSFTMFCSVISLPLIAVILHRRFTLILGCPTHFLAINVSPISYLFFLPSLFLTSFATFLHLMFVCAMLCSDAHYL